MCLNVVRGPVQCITKACAKLYCKICAEDMKKRNMPCSNRCAGNNSLQFQELDGITKRFMNVCKFKCLHEPKGCKTKLSIDLYNKHHEELCDFIRYKCECGYEAQKNEIEEHKKTCELFNGECPKCGDSMSLVKLVEHAPLCEAKPKTKECKTCKKFFPFGDLDKHEKDCVNLIVECQYCRIRFSKSDEDKHTKEVCFATTSKYNGFIKKK